MLNILSRRYPVARVVLVPVQVQGNGAAQTIIEGIRLLNRKNACDVMIVGRGGGSIEDLWAFNNEQLARTFVHIGSGDDPGPKAGFWLYLSGVEKTLSYRPSAPHISDPVAQVQVGNQMVTRLTDGEVYSTVSGIKEKKQ